MVSTKFHDVNKSHVTIPKEMAKAIKNGLLRPFWGYLASEIIPTRGSVMASQTVPIVIIKPAKLPESPTTSVKKYKP